MTEKLHEETKKTKDAKVTKATTASKEKALIEKEREKAKAAQKVALEKEREKQKEAQKVAIEKAIEKEREKQKALQSKAIEKERERIRQAIMSGKDPFKDSKPLPKNILNKTSEMLKEENVEEEEKIIAPVQKKSLEDLLKEKAEKEGTENEESSESLLGANEHLDHVEMLRRKREAQKKLNEEIKIIEDRDADIRAKLQAKALENQVEITVDKDETLKTIDESLNERITQLEEDNIRLADTVKTLAEELKDKDALINKQDEELKDKIEQITILTNSIVNNDAPTPTLEKEQPEEVNNDMLVEVKEQGDILIRIRLLNEKIAEKDAQIRLVEEELNKLTEQDIFEKEFISQVKIVREQRQEVVKQANIDLEHLAKQIRNNEDKLNAKREAYNNKAKELKEFEENYASKDLTYTEKEKEMVIRSRLIAEYDALTIEIEAIESNYKKLVSRYKDVLRKSELYVDNLSKMENELIQLYLKKLRDQKSNENEEYQTQKEQRESLLNELNQLNAKYEKIRQETKEETSDAPNLEIKADDVFDKEIANLKKNLASVEGKLRLLVTRRDERENVEEVLRTTDPEIRTYLEAFNEKETVVFELAEDENKLEKLSEEIKTIDPSNNAELTKVGSYITRYEIIIEENKLKLEYLNGIILQHDNNEKVLFYKQLLRSIVELDSKEKSLKEKAVMLRKEIGKLENRLDGE